MGTAERPKLALFEGKRIRKVMHQGEWRLVPTDIIAALTEATEG